MSQKTQKNLKKMMIKKKIKMSNKIFVLMLGLFSCMTSFQKPSECIQDNDIKDALVTALSYDDKLFDLHVDSSRLPLKIVINKFSKEKMDLEVFGNKAVYVRKKNLDGGDYVEIKRLKVNDCEIEIEFFVNKENASGDFIFKKNNGALDIIRSDIFEY